MQSYTHLLIAQLFNRHVADGDVRVPSRLPDLQPRAALLGSIMPDLPLIAISIAFILWDLVEGNPRDFDNELSRIGYLYRHMFFNDWRIKLAHNLFHAPLLAALYAVAGYWGWRTNRRWGAALFWFGVATVIHTAIDIPLHHDDGPLLLFPFDWQLRFRSPVSYWDPAHYGIPFTIFEHTLLLLIILALSRRWWRRRTTL